MNYIKLTSMLRRHKIHIFTLSDVRNLFPTEKEKTIKNNFIRWLSKGYFSRLRQDVYEFIEQGQELKIPDLYIANRLYGPSYVSLETALSIYSIIPDIAAGVTSITTRPTRTFKNKYGAFYYRACQRRAFVGYRLMPYEGFKVYIADKEKALVDFLYYRLRLNNMLDFYEERFNRKVLRKINWNRAFGYARIFNQKTINALKNCKGYVQC